MIQYRIARTVSDIFILQRQVNENEDWEESPGKSRFTSLEKAQKIKKIFEQQMAEDLDGDYIFEIVEGPIKRTKKAKKAKKEK